MTESRIVTICNDLGLHLRAAGILANVAGQFKAEITIIRDATHANAKSIMSILALAAAKGTELEISTEGEDAVEALKAIGDLIERGFKT